MKEQRFTTSSAEETQNLAGKILEEIKSMNKKIILLYGPLGSGKTTFVKGLAKALRIEKNITSPTYTYFNSYELPSTLDSQPLTIDARLSTLDHFDLYRLPENIENPDQVSAEIGLSESLENPKNLTVIEWPERLSISYENALQIHFSQEKGSHNIELKGE